MDHQSSAGEAVGRPAPGGGAGSKDTSRSACGSGASFAHVRPVDPEVLYGGDPAVRAKQVLLDTASGAEQLNLALIRTPPGSGSPEGLHVHPFEQAFYVVAGTMTVEAGGEVHEVPAGNVVVFPAGQPHRNWNAGTLDTVHLAIGAPAMLV